MVQTDGLDWQDYFEGMVLSFLEGLMKPDTRIYDACCIV
jgi:FMN phosphatase YigB (HAD superfamily)